MHFGATLRLLRLDSGLSLRDLARRLNVSGAYLSRVENGLDSVPTSARLESIARELDVPPTLLLGLTHRVSPLVTDYVQDVPEAGALFLELAQRRLDAQQLAEVHRFVSERFPEAGSAGPRVRPGISDLLDLDRIVVGLACTSIEDVFDVAGGRLAAALGKPGPAISAALKARERDVSSAIGGGVAVPCAYLADVEGPAAAVVTLSRPLEHETPDEEPLCTVIILAGPPAWADRRLRLIRVAHWTARGLSAELTLADSPTAVRALLLRMEDRPRTEDRMEDR